MFLTVLHRLMRGGSDLAADRWREEYRIAGSEDLDLHHLYRAMAWLGEELPADQQDDATPFAPRCTKDLIEEQLFAHRRDLFSRLDLVFMDTTSLYFEGLGGQSIGQYGYSKDHRPDLRQMILAVLIDGDGRPVCSEMWPGNTADVTSLVPVIDRLRRRFAIGRVCIVADRGMISAETIAALEARGLLYILGVRERTDKLVRDVVLNDAAPFVPLTDREARQGHRLQRQGGHARRGALHRLHQPSGGGEGRCRRAPLSWPHWSGSCTAATRRWSAIPAIGASSRPWVMATSPSIAAKAEEDARFDGVFVLRTNTDLNPLAAMLRYKQLWTVEQTFRTAKHLLATRPIFHKLDETIRGHVFCSFLALVLKAELEARIAALGQKGSWPAIIADLDALTETEVEQDGRRFMLRSAPRICCQPRFACRWRRAATNCAGDRRRLIANPEHVVPRRRRGANCRVLSITCRRALSKIGLNRDTNFSSALPIRYVPKLCPTNRSDSTGRIDATEEIVRNSPTLSDFIGPE